MTDNVFTTIGKWFTDIESKFIAFFTPQEKVIIDFFGPLFEQIKQEALVLGQQDLEAGLVILRNAALEAVSAAEKAPDGTDKVKAAEEAFIKTTSEQGQVLANTVASQAQDLVNKNINNAQAAAIKAAVAIIQLQATPANTTPVANTN
jgi:hypothetical protein